MNHAHGSWAAVAVAMGLNVLAADATYGQVGRARPQTRPSRVQTGTPQDRSASPAGQTAPNAPTASAGVRMATLPAMGYAFALDPAGGTVAAVLPSEPLVRVYPRLLSDADPAGAMEVKVGEGPCAVAFQQVGGKTCLLVLCENDQALYAIDPATQQTAFKIALTAAHPTGMAVSPRDQSVYYTTQEGRVGAVSLAQKADLGLLPPTAEGDGEFGQIAVSADGTTLYNRRVRSVPAGIRVFRIQDSGGKPTLGDSVYLHIESETVCVDPWGQYLATGRRLYSADLSDSSSLDGEDSIRCFLPDKPAMLAYREGQITAYSYNTQKLISSVNVPMLSGVTRRLAAHNARVTVGGANRTMEPAILAGGKNILVCLRDHVAVIDRTALNPPDEPTLAADIQGPRVVSVGQTAKFKIVRADPKTIISLQSGPKGMELAGDTLTWTPADGGPATATLAVSAPGGAAQRTQKLALSATRSVIELGFVPRDLVLSEDGKTAVAFSSTDRFVRRGGQNAPAAQVAVLDLASQKVLAQRTMDSHVGCAAMDSQNVYVGLADADAILVLKRSDLSDVRRVFTDGRINSMAAAGEKYLLVQCTRTTGFERRLAMQYQLPELTPVSEPATANNPALGYLREAAPQRVGEDWLFHGAVYDGSLQKAKMLLQPLDLPQLDCGGNQPRWDGADGPILSPWGTRVGGTVLWRNGQQVGSFTNTTAAHVLSDIPAALTLAVEEGRPQGRDADGVTIREITSQYVLSVRELCTGQVVQTLTLGQVSKSRQPGWPGDGDRYRIVSRAGVVAVQTLDRVYVLPVSSMDRQKLQAPVTFTLNQPNLMLKGDRPTVAFEVVGGKGPYEYGLTGEVRWLSIDRQSGKVTVDTALAKQKAMELVAQIVSNRRGEYGPASRPSGLQPIVESYRASLAGRYRELTGSQPDGIPVAIQIGVTARDSQQMSQTLSQAVLMCIPTGEVVAYLQKAEDTAKAAQAEQAAQRLRYMQQMNAREGAGAPTTLPSGGVGGAGESAAIHELRQRLSEAERRNAELEGQVKLLKEMLGNRAATTRP